MTGTARTQAINDITKLIRSQASQFYDESGVLLDPKGATLDDLADQIEAFAVKEEPKEPVRRYWRKALFVLISIPIIFVLTYAVIHGLFYGSLILTAIVYRNADFEGVLFATAFAGTTFGLLLGSSFFKFSNWLDSRLYRLIVGVERSTN